MNQLYRHGGHLHGTNNPQAISAGLPEAQRTAKQQGKSRFIGVGTHIPPAIADRVIPTCHTRGIDDGLLNRYPESEFIKSAREANPGKL